MIGNKISVKIIVGFSVLMILVIVTNMQTIIMNKRLLGITNENIEISGILDEASKNIFRIASATNAARFENDADMFKFLDESLTHLHKFLKIIEKSRNNLPRSQIDILLNHAQKFKAVFQHYVEAYKTETDAAARYRIMLDEFIRYLLVLNQKYGEPDATFLLSAILRLESISGPEKYNAEVANVDKAVSNFIAARLSSGNFSEDEKQNLLKLAKKYEETLKRVVDRMGQSNEIRLQSKAMTEKMVQVMEEMKQAHHSQQIAETREFIQAKLRALFITTAVAIMIGMIAAFIIARSITRPLMTVAELARNLAVGNPDAGLQADRRKPNTGIFSDVHSRPTGTGPGLQTDEISLVLASLTAIRERIKDLAGKMRQASVSAEKGAGLPVFDDNNAPGDWKKYIQDLNVICQSKAPESGAERLAGSRLQDGDSVESYLAHIAESIDALNKLGREIAEGKRVLKIKQEF